MRKRVILALMLAITMIVTTGCGLIVKDAEVDKQTPIIEVAGKVFTKGEVTEQVDYSLDYQAYIYSMYGLTFDSTDASVIAEIQQSTIDALIRQAVLEKKAEDTGANVLTDEEIAAAQTEADTTYNGYVESIKTSYFAETELTGEELDNAVAAKLTELGYPTLGEVLESQKKTKAQDKLKDDVVKDVQVTDEEIQASYDEKVAEAKTKYESDLPSYGSAVSSGTTVYYAPAGYRYVKHILRKLSEEDTAAIDDASTQLSDKQALLSDAETSLASLNEDPAQDTAEDAQNRKEWEETKATLSVEIADLQKTLDETREAAYAKVQTTIDEILQKLSEGEDFDALVTEYGEDEGMKTSPAMEQGYLVCLGDTRWVPEFTTAAMELAKVGDISPAVRTDYGIHILTYAGDLQEGAVPLDSVKDTISGELLTSKQDALFESTVSEWITEANAKVDLNALK